MRKSTPALFSGLCAIGLISPILASVEVAASDPDWTLDVTVLTVASNGAWGTGTSGRSSAAIAAAIGDCRQRAAVNGGTGGGCGARQVYSRNGWLLAYACGERMFAVSGRTLTEARIAAVAQELDWREVHRLDIPACRLVVAIGPDGKPTASCVASGELPVVSGPSYVR